MWRVAGCACARPTDPLGAEPKQYRISTGLAYPDQATESLQLAEQPDGVSGRQAVRLTREWWGKQRRRGPSAEDSWKVDYDAPLAPLLEISPLRPDHLLALVEATPSGSRSRRRASQAAATVARALDWPEVLVSQLRELGKGYSAARSQAPRDLPKDEAIEALIDRLSASWQWPVALAAVYGCRPHEALLFAEVQPSGLLRIADGKTGARQSLALPAERDPAPAAEQERPEPNRQRQPHLRVRLVHPSQPLQAEPV